MTKESNTAHDDAVSTTTAASQSTDPTTDAHEALNALDSLQTLKTLNTDRERLAKRSEQGLQTINMRSTPIFALMVFVYWGIGLMFGGHFYSDVSYIVIMTTLALILIAAIVIMARYQKTTGISLFTMAPHGRTAFRDHGRHRMDGGHDLAASAAMGRICMGILQRTLGGRDRARHPLRIGNPCIGTMAHPRICQDKQTPGIPGDRDA
ncbi:hypothetical protein EM849_06185 [Bifidobacterium tissieri]|nr:hypothetical protein EM849_06185 [Bifidobacterium tissieri]